MPRGGDTKAVITEKKAKVKELLLEGHNAYQASLKAGVHPLSVAKWFPDLSERNRGINKISWDNYSKDIFYLRKQGKNYNEIAIATGINKTSIAAFCKKNNIELTAEEKELINTLNEDEVLFRIDSLAFSYLGGYKNFDSKIKLQCKVCNHIFERVADYVFRHHVECPACMEAEKEFLKAQKVKLKQEEKAAKLLKYQYQKAEKARQKAEEKEAGKNRTCLLCSKAFYSDRKTNYCMECKSQKQAEQKRKYNKNKELKRRLKLQSAMVDNDITVPALAERDNNKCYLCGKEVNFGDYYVREGTIICGDSYPSIDHIVPLAKGGKHSWDNVKLAHRICNSLKSDILLNDTPPGIGF